MRRQSGKVSSHAAAIALAVLLIAASVISDAVSEAIMGPEAAALEADQSWRKVTVLGAVATVGDKD